MCNKIPYDKKNAQTALNALLEKGNLEFGRIYHCRFCKRWHLTSHQRESSQVVEVPLLFKEKWKQLLEKTKEYTYD